MPLYRYRCDLGHEAELLRSRDVERIECACGAVAERQAVNLFAMGGKAVVPRDERSYRQSYAEFQEETAEVAHDYQKHRENGEGGQEPDYYRLAKQQAAAKGAPIL